MAIITTQDLEKRHVYRISVWIKEEKQYSLRRFISKIDNRLTIVEVKNIAKSLGFDVCPYAKGLYEGIKKVIPGRNEI